MGNFLEAKQLFVKTLRIREGALGRSHPATGMTLDELALLHWNMGDYASAEDCYRRALDIFERQLGPEHPLTAHCINSLAELFRETGDYQRALPLQVRALAVREKVQGPEHLDTANSLVSLADLYRSMGKIREAQPLCERALSIFEQKLGSEHPQTAQCRRELAFVCESKGDLAQAEELYLSSLATSERVLGPNHADTGNALNNLAGLYQHMGRYASAEPLYRRALAITTRALGPAHPYTVLTLEALAYIMIDTQRPSESLEFAIQSARSNEHTLQNIMSFAPETQRLAYQATKRPYTLFATLGNAYWLAQTVLRQKGVVLDSLLEDKLVAVTSKDPAARLRAVELHELKQRLAQLSLEMPRDLSEGSLRQLEAERLTLLERAETLERAFAKNVSGLGRARRALTVTVEQVQKVLPQSAALVEFIRYPHYLGGNKTEDRYGCVIIAPTSPPSWVPLGSAKQVDELVRRYQKLVRGGVPGPRTTSGRSRGESDFATKAVLSDLYTTIWQPVQQHLSKTTETIIVSPDGLLNFVSFATLLGPGDLFLGETATVSYVASGRDLVRKLATSSKDEAVLFAAPDYNLQIARASRPASSSVAQKGAPSRLPVSQSARLQSLMFPPLPGTTTEIREVGALIASTGWTVLRREGGSATERELRGFVSPRLLHLATHGFFLPGVAPSGAAEGGSSNSDAQAPFPFAGTTNRDAMRRSGIALAGANTTIQAWSRGEFPEPSNDGILSAEEAGALELSGTWLVGLSACETGMGEAVTGEGVMGLRRGFVQAGAHHLLLTLWPVSDLETANFMRDYYTEALRTMNAPSALAVVQRKWLTRLRQTRGIQTAVNLAGAFIISTQGSLGAK